MARQTRGRMALLFPSRIPISKIKGKPFWLAL
jgi:hypothetical protein